jgi:chromosomal replication initiation ATPase DnaA
MENLKAVDNSLLLCVKYNKQYRDSHIQEYIKSFNEIIKDEIEIAKERICRNINPLSDVQPKIDLIYKVVCDEWLVDARVLMDKTRRAYYSIPRHLVRWLMFKGYSGMNFTLENIGLITVKVSESPNHATILHSIEVVDNMIETDYGFKAKVDRCIEKLLETNQNKEDE